LLSVLTHATITTATGCTPALPPAAATGPASTHLPAHLTLLLLLPVPACPAQRLLPE
jgi:hypothetical protein